ncbi:MAG: TIGR03086 family metal-binding protein [Pseudonocardiaceae bacterium]
MNEPKVFVLADEALVDIVTQIRDDQWSSELPPGFLTSQLDPRPTLREVINYHAYDDAWVPDMLAGRTMDEAGRDKFDGDLLGADPKASFAAIAQAACAAARNLDDLDRVVHCSFGDFPAREYFWQINGFRGLRAHDLARVIGVEPELPDELVQGMWDEISPHAEEWRAIGVFPAAVPVPGDAPLLHRLLGLTGRNPAWRP